MEEARIAPRYLFKSRYFLIRVNEKIMNEETNFCSQCGATVSPDAKFCSSCGHDLQNSSTQIPLNENEKVETDIDNP